MPKKSNIVPLPLKKSRIFLVGKAGETHTENYVAKTIEFCCKEGKEQVIEHLVNTIPKDEIWCMSVSKDNKLEVCRLVDIDFKLLNKRLKV